MSKVPLQICGAAKDRTNRFLKYYWNYYSELARQRNEIQEELKIALLSACRSNFDFSRWQRAVKYKYGLHPFSTIGSLQFTGGRFNTGVEVNSEVPSFAALYLAEDKDTALQEHLAQDPHESNSPLSPREIALTNPDSETIISVSGHLDKVFDLTKVENLKPFVSLIKEFKLSETLLAEAASLKIEKPGVIQDGQQLLDTILAFNWREWPANFDVPANPQIFGHLIFLAGIEGILYPSKFTQKPCLAIFPVNLSGTDSHFIMDDGPPHPKVPTRIDGSNWRVCDLSSKEIIGE